MAASLITEGVFQGNQDSVKFMGQDDLYTLGKESKLREVGCSKVIQLESH